MEKAHISDLTAHLKSLEQKEADSPRRSRRQKIMRLKVEINKIETKKIQRINENLNFIKLENIKEMDSFLMYTIYQN